MTRRSMRSPRSAFFAAWLLAASAGLSLATGDRMTAAALAVVCVAMVITMLANNP